VFFVVNPSLNHNYSVDIACFIGCDEDRLKIWRHSDYVNLLKVDKENFMIMDY